MQRSARGFTLIEILVTVAIVGILTAIAVPSYRDYVVRSRLTDAYSGLATVQPQAEQYWANERSYEDFDRLPAATANFSFTLTAADATSYTVTATGIGNAAGFVFTIDQSGNRATTGVPSGWTGSASCWINDKGGKCID